MISKRRKELIVRENWDNHDTCHLGTKFVSRKLIKIIQILKEPKRKKIFSFDTKWEIIISRKHISHPHYLHRTRVEDFEIRTSVKIRSQLIAKWPARVKYRNKTDAGAAINIRNERDFRFMKFARGVWISGERWWKFNRHTRILDIGAGETQAQFLKLHRGSLVQLLQGLQIVSEHLDLAPVLAPLSPLFPLSLSLCPPAWTPFNYRNFRYKFISL